MLKMKQQMIKKVILRKIIIVGGIIISMVALLPLPWSVRCLFMRSIYVVQTKAKYKASLFFEFLESDNLQYNTGKRNIGDYLSIKQLESLLKHAETKEIPFEQLKALLRRSETQKIPLEILLKETLEQAKTPKTGLMIRNEG